MWSQKSPNKSLAIINEFLVYATQGLYKTEHFLPKYAVCLPSDQDIWPVQ